MVGTVATGVWSVGDATSIAKSTGVEDGISKVRQLLHEDPMPDHPQQAACGIPVAELEPVVGCVPTFGH